MSNEMKDWLEEQTQEEFLDEFMSYLNLRTLNKRDFVKHRTKKWKRQRITRGFSDYDVWNLDGFLIHVIANSIEHLAQTCHSYPGREPWETPEKYREYLMNIVRNLREGYRLSDTFNMEDYKKSEELIKVALHDLGEVFFTLWD